MRSAAASAPIAYPHAAIARTTPSRPVTTRTMAAKMRTPAAQAAAIGNRRASAQQAVGVLVGGALPRTVRVAEVDRQPGIDAQLRVLDHLGALVPGQRATQRARSHCTA